MRIRRREDNGVTRIWVSGLLRASPRSIAWFNRMMTALSRDVKAHDLDLRSVYFIDSMWLGFLVTLLVRCRDNGIPLTISGVSKPVWNTMQVMHLDQVLPAPAHVETRTPLIPREWRKRARVAPA